MEAMGLVTWRPWLRLVVAVGSGGRRQGPFCLRLPELGAAGDLAEAAAFRPLQLGTWRGTRRLGSIKCFGDDGSL